MAAIQRTTKQQILDAVHDLHNTEQMVTREALQVVTGLKLTIIDDRLATLVDDGLLVRMKRGVFVPAVLHPPARPISKTVTPGGLVKIEIGDVVLDLTPREDRMLAGIQAGAALQFIGVGTEQDLVQVVADLRLKVREMETRQRGACPVPEDAQHSAD